MANTTTTNLEVKTERGQQAVKKLGQTISEALSPKHAKELKTATRDLERQFGAAAKAQAVLIKQLEGVKRGTEEYKKLKGELKGVADQADLASKALAQIERAQSRASRQAKEGRGRNFGLGLAQGAGIAQYLPSGPGAGSRLAGAMIGGAVRRGAGAAAAPFTMPGIGGLAQGLSGIPIVGGFAAGAISTAAAARQAAVGYDRARLGNLYFSNANRGRRSSTGANPEYTLAQEHLDSDKADREKVMDVQGQHQSDQQMLADINSKDPRRRRRAQQRAMSGDSPTAKRVAARMRGANVGQKIASLSGGRGFGGYGRAAGIRTVPNVGQIQDRQLNADIAENKAQLDAANARVGEASERLQGTRKTVGGGRMTGLGSMSLGVKFGYGPMQMEGMKGEMFGASGGTYDNYAFQESMAAKVRYGVSSGQSGQFRRMGLGGGGGQEGGSQSLASVLQGAFVSGLRGSQVTEYLGTLVGLGQQAEKQGLKISAEGFQTLTMSMGAAGLKGPQQARVAGGLTTGLQGLAQRGVQSPVDMMRLRAAGFEPGQGMEGYATAMANLEDPTKQTEIIQKFLAMAAKGTAGVGKNSGALLFKRLMGKGGTSVSMGQASQMIEAYKDGKPPDIQKLLADREAKGGTAGMVKGAVGDVGIGASAARAGARLEAQRIGVGKGAGWVDKFESNGIKAAGAMNNFSGSLTKLAGLAESLIKVIDKFTEGDLGGIWAKLSKSFGMGGGKKPPTGK